MNNRWFKRLSNNSNKPSKDTDEGYTLLMDIIDRKVFDVEDDGVTSEEFGLLSDWMVNEYDKATVSSISGRVVKEDPVILVEVVERQPIYIEIHDYKVRYRVNLYPSTEEVTIQVLDTVKEKELGYNLKPQVIINLG